MVKLIIGNLPPSATNKSLKDIFDDYEDLQDYKLISNYGFVYLDSEDSADHAIHNLNGLNYRGFMITVRRVGERGSPRKESAPILPPNPFKHGSLGKRKFIPPILKQTNLNPCNNSFFEGNNISKSFDQPPGKKYIHQNPQSELRNPNPYNLPQEKINTNDRWNHIVQKKMPGLQPFGEFDDSIPDKRCQVQFSRGYNPHKYDKYRFAGKHHYIPQEIYFSNVHFPMPFGTNEFNGDGCGQSNNEFRHFNDARPPMFDSRPMSNNRSLPNRPEGTSFIDRGKNRFEPKRSHPRNRYAVDPDCGAANPNPSYSEQYKKSQW